MAIRFVLVLVSELMDANAGAGTPKYTDVDYFVYSEAATLVAWGRSPYLRDTYRYSPLIAMMLVPNEFVHTSWGKWLFVVGDGAVGLLIYWFTRQRGTRNTPSPQLCTILWLLNPLTVSISTRGSCESINCAMVIGVVCLLMKGKVILAAILYGLVVHLRIYPIIYSIGIILALNDDFLGVQKAVSAAQAGGSSRFRRRWKDALHFLNKERIIFAMVSGSTFIILTFIFYLKYGEQFLREAIFYHLTRSDHRHNFSSYFLPIYLTMEGTSMDRNASLLLRWIGFIPQLVVQSSLALLYARDLPFFMFISTLAFVAFNKVCTAQYFVWFFCLLPLTAQQWKFGWKFAIGMFLVWAAAQLHWLWWAYSLEFLGQNVFFQVWMASVLFFGINTWVIVQCIRGHSYQPLFDSGKVSRVA